MVADLVDMMMGAISSLLWGKRCGGSRHLGILQSWFFVMDFVHCMLHIGLVLFVLATVGLIQGDLSENFL